MRRNLRYFAIIFVFGPPLLVAFWYLVYLVSLNSDNGSSTTGVVEEQGQRLYQEWGCDTCHGDNGNGSPKGPSLRELSRYWDEQSLMQYLQNPKDVRSRNDRLLQLSKRYFPVSMPAMEGLTEEELALLAHYLLGRNDD